MSEPSPLPDTLKRVDLLKAYKLRVLHRLSYQDIADKLDVSKASVHRALSTLIALLPTAEQQQAYQDARPDLLSVVEERLLASLADEEKISKASLNNVAYAITQVSSLRRLETGQSTSNIATLTKLIGSSDDALFPPKSGNRDGKESVGEVSP